MPRPSAPKYFRFLDLPPELRLMIYEFLPVEIQHHHVHTGHHDFPKKRKDVSALTHPTVTLITQAAPTAILSTCRFINAEASPIIKKKKATLSKNAFPKIITDSRRLNTLLKKGGILDMATTLYGERHYHRHHLDRQANKSGWKIGSPSGCCAHEISSFVRKTAYALRREQEIHIELRPHPTDSATEVKTAVGTFCEKAADMLERCGEEADDEGSRRRTPHLALRCGANHHWEREWMRRAVRRGYPRDRYPTLHCYKPIKDEEWDLLWAEQEWI